MTEKKHEADVAFIRALAELLRENDLTELQVKREYAQDDTLNVRVSRMQPAPVAAAPTLVAAPAPAAAAAPAAPAATQPAPAPPTSHAPPPTTRSTATPAPRSSSRPS